MTSAILTALLDVDGVLADFPSGALRWLNGRAVGPGAFTIEQITQHDILKAFDLEHEQDAFDVWCSDTDMCRHLDVYEGAQAFVEELKSFADVVIVTASYGAVRGWESARRAWLLEHFGISKRDVVFAKRKELVAGNFLLDDKLRNIDAWRNAWGHQGQAVVFDRPWNQGIQFRVRTYDEALAAARGVKRVLEAKP